MKAKLLPISSHASIRHVDAIISSACIKHCMLLSHRGLYVHSMLALAIRNLMQPVIGFEIDCAIEIKPPVSCTAVPHSSTPSMVDAVTALKIME
jgi:hypothetical protein